jgi:hypothetical protein
MRRVRGVGIARSLLAAGVLVGVSSLAEAVPTREGEAVVVLGSEFPEYHGKPVLDLVAHRWDAGSGSFVPVPFQVDPRFEHVFNRGTSDEFSELLYDVLREDDGLLDADDELAFLLRDAGPRAPAGALGPPGAEALRYEIAVTDPRVGSTTPPRWLYLLAGSGLPRSTDAYVRWDGRRWTGIAADRYRLGYADKWLLTGLVVKTPCGGGVDLLDRIKGRAGFALDRGENEALWNLTSFYLGALVGPVRVIRYVKGAASGFNTIHHDVVYPEYWERHIALRVHAVSDVWLYADLLPRAGTTFLADTVAAPVAVDGSPDAVPATLPRWAIVRGSAGGLLTVYDVPPSAFVTERRFLYLDDASFDDRSSWFFYGDQDDSAYGVHGVNLSGVTGSDTDTIQARMRFYPLCSDEGGAALGQEVRSRYDVRLAAEASAQTAP